jgi:hypothetical protein
MAVVPHLKNGNVLMKNGNVRGCCCTPEPTNPCNICDPDVTILYCLWIPNYEEEALPDIYFEATGSLNVIENDKCWGRFEGSKSEETNFVTIYLSWEHGISTEWRITFTAAVPSTGVTWFGSDNRCDPSTSIALAEGTLIISTEPLV